MINSRRMRVECVACLGETRSAYSTPVRNPEGKRPLGRTRHKRKDNIKIYLREIRWEGVDWNCDSG
jgi:hypothetical protein